MRRVKIAAPTRTYVQPGMRLDSLCVRTLMCAPPKNEAQQLRREDPEVRAAENETRQLRRAIPLVVPPKARPENFAMQTLWWAQPKTRPENIAVSTLWCVLLKIRPESFAVRTLRCVQQKLKPERYNVQTPKKEKPKMHDSFTVETMISAPLKITLVNFAAENQKHGHVRTSPGQLRASEVFRRSKSRQNIFNSEVTWRHLAYFPVLQVVRQKQATFAAALTNIGYGEALNYDELSMLQSRFVTKAEASRRYSQGVRLFYGNKDVEAFSIQDAVEGISNVQTVHANDTISVLDQPHRLAICSLNVRSLTAHRIDVIHHHILMRVPILCFSETWGPLQEIRGYRCVASANRPTLQESAVAIY
ncbi:hypothetical protein MTO96_015329 [Rhipicephalus appendiculatus]